MGGCIKKSSATEPILSKKAKAEEINQNQGNILKITDIYTLKKVIGQGSFGIVRRGARIDNPNIQVAIKTITKSKLKDDLSLLKNEVEILRTIDHPNIVKLFEFFDEEHFFHIVTEFCSGGELFERIVSNGRLTEGLVMKYMKKMLRAINHLHKLKICHRDVKPQNFLFESMNPDSELKLIDFGLSHNFQTHKKKNLSMESFAGTPYYIAPEVLKGPYDFKCDIWSLGIIMCLMLTGTHPFIGNSSAEIYHSIINDPLNTKSHEFKHISDLGIDLIKNLLAKDPKVRFSAEQALSHPWMKNAKEQSADLNIFKSLQNYKPPSQMWRAAVGILVKYTNSDDLAALRTAFNEIDIENTGYLSIKEIGAALSRCGVKLPKHELVEVFKRIDHAKDGKIHYSEFLAATVSSKMVIDEQMIWTLFNSFDIDRSGEITLENLKEVFRRMGLHYTDERIANIIKEVNTTRTGAISFIEFKKMMLQKAVL